MDTGILTVESRVERHEKVVAEIGDAFPARCRNVRDAFDGKRLSAWTMQETTDTFTGFNDDLREYFVEIFIGN